MRPSSASSHIFPGCCFTSSTARIESASGVASSCVEPTPDDVRAAERIRRTDEREEVVPLVEVLERVREPLDVGRGRGRVLGRTQEGHVGAVPARDVGDLLRVGRDDDALEAAALARGLDRVREQRVAGERPDVLVRNALRARRAPGRTRPPRLAHRSPAADGELRERRAGNAEPSAARRTPPRIASSSERRPATTSRAAEVVVSSAISSMIAHCADGPQRDAVGLGDRARLHDRRRRAAGATRDRSAARRPVRPDADVDGGERRDARELVPEHALLALPDPNVDARPREASPPPARPRSRESVSDAIVMTGAVVASTIWTRRRGRPGSERCSRPRRDRRSAPEHVHVLETVEQRNARHRRATALGSIALDRVVERRGLDGDEQEVDRLRELLDHLHARRERPLRRLDDETRRAR